VVITTLLLLLLEDFVKLLNDYLVHTLEDLNNVSGWADLKRLCTLDKSGELDKDLL